MILVTTHGGPHGVRGRLVLALSAALAAGAAGACERPSRAALPLDPDAYVTVMAELTDLRRFPPPGPDETARSARADSARARILDRHGVTADELLVFAELVGPDPDRMLELTERIVALSDSLARARGEPFGGEDAGRPGAASAGDSAAGAIAGDAVSADSGRVPARRPIDPERLERLRRSLAEESAAP